MQSRRLYRIKELSELIGPDGHPNSPTYGHLKSPTLMD